jgi:hypothetical protein
VAEGLRSAGEVVRGIEEIVGLINVCQVGDGKHRWRPVQWEQSVNQWAESMRSGKFPVGEKITVKASCCCGAHVTYEQERPL